MNTSSKLIMNPKGRAYTVQSKGFWEINFRSKDSGPNWGKALLNSLVSPTIRSPHDGLRTWKKVFRPIWYSEKPLLGRTICIVNHAYTPKVGPQISSANRKSANVRQTSDLLHESNRNSDPLHAPTETGTIDSHAHNKTSALHAPNRTSDHLHRTKQNL